MAVYYEEMYRRDLENRAKLKRALVDQYDNLMACRAKLVQLEATTDQWLAWHQAMSHNLLAQTELIRR